MTQARQTEIGAQPGVLFTAFEPSGDAHAAGVIAELRRRRPELPIYAWGGPKMRAAGAVIVEATGADAVMGAGSLGKVLEHARLNRRLRRWLAGHPVALHVPVDSPAANFPICKITRRVGCRIVHLVAPQIWAWGPWRIGKLKRLTDHVLCLLPFEEEYFKSRGVPATFIGHPVMNEPLPAPPLPPEEAEDDPNALPEGLPRVALLPGSRPAEIERNLPTMIAIVDGLRRAEYAQLTAVIISADRKAADLARASIPALPGFVRIEVDRLHAVLRWADAAMVCSGTATLNVVRHRVPMVVMFRTSVLAWWLFGRWVLRSPNRALPNVVLNERVVPEFIPHFGSDEPIATALDEVLTDRTVQDRQRDAFTKIAAMYQGRRPEHAAAEILERTLKQAAMGK